MSSERFLGLGKNGIEGDIFILGCDFFSESESAMVTVARTGAAERARRAPQMAERDSTGEAVNESAGTNADIMMKVSKASKEK